MAAVSAFAMWLQLAVQRPSSSDASGLIVDSRRSTHSKRSAFPGSRHLKPKRRTPDVTSQRHLSRLRAGPLHFLGSTRIRFELRAKKPPDPARSCAIRGSLLFISPAPPLGRACGEAHATTSPHPTVTLRVSADRVTQLAT